MTNETKPVLLTASDLLAMETMTPKLREAFLRERGLIAPEPEADPLEAAVVNALEADGWSFSTASAHTLAAALRGQGMELAKPELTREMVREAIHEGQRRHHGGTGTVSNGFLEGVYDALHAALQGQSK